MLTTILNKVSNSLIGAVDPVNPNSSRKQPKHRNTYVNISSWGYSELFWYSSLQKQYFCCKIGPYMDAKSKDL